MDYRDRLQAIADAEDRSPHFLMKEAIVAYVEKKEAERRFIDAAKASRAHYKATGQHITAEEFEVWVSQLGETAAAPLPVCHD